MQLLPFHRVFFCASLFFCPLLLCTTQAAAPTPLPSSAPASPAIDLQAEVTNLTQAKQQLEQQLNRITSEYQQLKQISGQAVYLSEANQKMRAELELNRIEVEKLTQQNYQLSNDNRVDGILQGCIAVVVGALLALYIPRASSRKRQSSWD